MLVSMCSQHGTYPVPHCPFKFSFTTNWSDKCFCIVGGDEWKPIAEKLGFNPQEIRYLDRRYPNSAAELLIYIADRRGLTVGNLYDVLVDSGLPRLADDYL